MVTISLKRTGRAVACVQVLVEVEELDNVDVLVDVDEPVEVVVFVVAVVDVALVVDPDAQGPLPLAEDASI